MQYASRLPIDARTSNDQFLRKAPAKALNSGTSSFDNMQHLRAQSEHAAGQSSGGGSNVVADYRDKSRPNALQVPNILRTLVLRHSQNCCC